MNTKPANRSLIVLGTIICQMGLGTIYTWSLFNQPLVDKFHWGWRTSPPPSPSPASSWPSPRCSPASCKSASASAT